MRGAITSDPDVAGVLARVRRAPVMTGLDLVPQGEGAAPYHVTETSWRAPDQTPLSPPSSRRSMRVVAYDFGVKRLICSN